MVSMEGLKESSEGVILWNTGIPCSQLQVCDISVCTGTASLLSGTKEFIQVLVILQQGSLCSEDHMWINGDCSTASMNGSCSKLRITSEYADRVLHRLAKQ